MNPRKAIELKTYSKLCKSSLKKDLIYYIKPKKVQLNRFNKTRPPKSKRSKILKFQKLNTNSLKLQYLLKSV